MAIVRYFLLEALDRTWKEHLRGMDALRDGIGLRGYGQTDPKQAYQHEGFIMFQDMLFRIKESVWRTLSRVHIDPQPQNQSNDSEPILDEEFRHKDNFDNHSYVAGGTVETEQSRKEKSRRSKPKIGRNELCPCGSGKKYKKCCGRNVK